MGLPEDFVEGVNGSGRRHPGPIVPHLSSHVGTRNHQGQSCSKREVPARPYGQAGTKLGMGVRHALFPMPTLGALQAAGFPTLFSTASGVFGLVAGPFSAFRSLNY